MQHVLCVIDEIDGRPDQYIEFESYMNELEWTSLEGIFLFYRTYDDSILDASIRVAAEHAMQQAADYAGIPAPEAVLAIA